MAKKELWLSRENTPYGHYNLHTEDPSGLSHSGIYQYDIICFSAESFHSIFSIRLRKGRKKKIKRILIELEK